MKPANAILVFALATAGLWLLTRSHKSAGTGNMTDSPVSLDNVRKGVARGWYKAALTRVNGKPAVRLSGKLGNGQEYSDVYPITESNWQDLRKDGLPVV